MCISRVKNTSFQILCTNVHTYSRKRRAKDSDSDLIPFEERPFGSTPADDQYIHEDQALNWSEGTVAYGENTFDEHAFDEYQLDKDI